jgi:hypothetical protein
MGKTNKKLTILNNDIFIYKQNRNDFISLTDIARYKNSKEPKDVVKNWFRNRNTIEFLGLWEKINNPSFKGVEFDSFRMSAGLNSFVLSPQKWINTTQAIGVISKSGRYGGTYAHKDIAFEFASWISAEFKLFLIKEFQRLKEQEYEREKLSWSAKRMLTKINYRIHTDSIKEHLVPKLLNKNQIRYLYANEADVLNISLFGITAKDWKSANSDLDGNMRDYANVIQLVCLANLESFNAEFIRQGLEQSERLKQLNEIAIIQMKSLVQSSSIKKMISEN